MKTLKRIAAWYRGYRIRPDQIASLIAANPNGLTGSEIRVMLWERGIRVGLYGCYQKLAKAVNLGLIRTEKETEIVSGFQIQRDRYFATDQ